MLFWLAGFIIGQRTDYWALRTRWKISARMRGRLIPETQLVG
jgi:hypothetical protein